jgi:succinoglycan biosynthesis transport protein ExoP
MEQKERLKDIDLMEYWQVVVRRKWLLAAFAGTLIVLTAIYSFLVSPQYKATATLLIEEESSRILSINEAFGDQAQVFRDLRGYNTQIQLLKSRSLAERVAKKLDLLSRPEFGGQPSSKRGFFSTLKHIITLKWLFPKKKANPENPLFPANPYSPIVSGFLASLEISPIKETKLVELSFTFGSPTLSTEIVNSLAEEFINFSSEKRVSTTQQASEWLSEQIDNLRNNLTAKERELLRYSQEKDIVFLSETESAAVKSFSDLNDAYNRAILDRINAEAEWRELKNLEAGSVPQAVSDPAITQLKTEYTRLSAEFEEKSRLLKPDHPEMLGIKARMDSLKDEINKAADAAEARYRSALQKEYSIRATLDRQRADVTKMENNAILYNSIRSEVESMRGLLSSLQERQSETQLSAQLKGLSATNISIIDKAEVPRKPVSPDRKKNLLMSLLIGLFGGVGLCFLFEYLDDTIKGPPDVERLADVPPLGIVPHLPPDGLSRSKGYSSYLRHRYARPREGIEREHTLPEIKEIELINHFHPELPFAEDYRTIRTSILLSHAEKPPKTIVFSSPLTQEGKSATVANVAVSFAQLEEKVLVVDTDLRKPRLHRVFKVRNVTGLTGFLTGKAPLKEVVEKTFIENIWLIPSGPIPPNPAELLNSRKMKDLIEEIGQVFDIVLLDSPPVLAVSDTVLISSFAESCVLVVRSGQTRRKPFLSAVQELNRARAKIIGVVFNGADLSKEAGLYPKYYGYSLYGMEDFESPVEKPGGKSS